MMASSQPHRNAFRLAVSYPDFKDWQTQTDVFADMALVSGSRALTLTGESGSEHLTVELVSENYFSMLGVSAIAGRTFGPEDSLTPGGHPLALLSFDLWVRRFGRDPSIVGQQILLNNRSYTVTGVLDPVYRGTWWDAIDLWVPTAMVTEGISEEYLDSRTRRWGTVMGRLQDGVTFDQAREAMNRFAEQLEQEHPLSNKGYRVAMYTLHDVYYDYSSGGLKKAFWGGFLLLLLSCVSVAGLMLTRGTLRRQEVAVRSALGASRKRLLFEELGQSVLLALAGGGLGLLLAAGTTRWLVSLSTIPTMNTENSFIDPVVIAASLGFTLLAGLIFGVAPAFQAAGTDPQRFLKPGAGKASPGRGFRGLLDGLAVGELALAVVLLVSAGVGVQTFFDLRDGSVGYATRDLLTMRFDFSSTRLQEDGARERFSQLLVSEVNSLPGVEGSGVVGPYAPPNAILYTDVTIEDRLADSIEDAALRSYRQAISPGYLEVADIALLEGREFRAQDTADAPRVAIVGKRFADQAWPSESAVGKRIRRGLPAAEEEPWMTVVGDAEGVKSRGPKDFGRGPGIDLYMPLLQNAETVPTPTLVVRAKSSAGATQLAEPVRQVVQRLDPEVPVYQVMTMDRQIGKYIQDDYFIGVILLLFGAFATLIAAVGIFGILSYGVRRRLHEFGVRLALGGSRGSVMSLVLKRGAVVLGAGLALGSLLVLGFSKYLPGGVFELKSANPLIFVSVLGFLVLVSILAMLIPALRATRVPPTQAIRSE